MNKNISRKKVSSALVALLLTLILAFQTFIMVTKFTAGAASPTEDYQYFKMDKDVVGTSSKLNREIAAEGMVLLKNDGLLPLQKKDGKKVKVSIFGKQSAEIEDRGFGSSDTYYGYGNLYSAFDQNGTFEVNPTLKAFYNQKGENSASGQFRMNNDRHGSMDNYKSGLPITETPYSMYTDAVKSSYKDYNDAAIVMLSRYGGEGNDLPTTSLKSWATLDDSNKLDDARSWDSHYLQLDINEVAMLQNVMDNFENVIVLVNSANPIELGFVKDPTHYLYTDNNYAPDETAAKEKMSRLKAVMHVGFPGSTGAQAIPDLLDGTVNPSGRLADTWAVDFMNNPVLQNFSFNQSPDGNKSGIEFVHYDEDIYMGYRYYETKYVTSGGNNEAGNAWYDKEVMYPFGYGLSYTSFEQELLKDESTAQNSELKKDGTITTKVKVTNKGTRAGKETVQLYYNTPYYTNGISKAHVVLGAFQKTEILQPGESVVLEFETKVSEMYSYDWSDANKNGFKGYELDNGLYNVAVAKNAHEAAKLDPLLTSSYKISEGFKYDTDTTTGAKIGNLFDDVSGEAKKNADTFMGVREYATRDNNFKTSSAAEKKNVVQEAVHQSVSTEFDAGKPWYTDEQPVQATTSGTSETNVVKLWHLKGRDYDDPLWDKLLDQLTFREMADLIGQAFSHTEAIPSIDKARSVEWDGPLGRRNSQDIQWVTNTLLAQTFNVELAYRQGIQFGNAGLSEGQVGGTYGIGLNTHRSPFGGRNFEYYSEDGLLAGKMAAKVLLGTGTKGTYHTLKHFVVNDQETARNNIQTWLSEQALREIYAKPFEIAVKEGKANAIMAGVNSIGAVTCAESWPLMTGLLRNEWGFKGFVITDLVTRNVDVCIRAGTNLMMVFGNNAPKYDVISLTPTQASAIRQSVKDVFYVMANSNVVNGYGGESLDLIDYGGVGTLYAVEGIDNAISVGSAETDVKGKQLNYSMQGADNLPEGMTLAKDGSLSGAPSAKGTYSFTVLAGEEVTDSVRYPLKPKAKDYTLKVYGKDELPDTIIYEDDFMGIIPFGFSFSKNIASAVAFTSEGKLNTDIKYSLASGDLPDGLTLKDGVISGVTTAVPGSYFFTIKAETADGSREPKLLSFIVEVKVYRVFYEAQEIADLKVGETIALDIATAKNNEGLAIKYSLKSGSTLPQGLSLSSAGLLYGTATRGCSDHQFTVVAKTELSAPKEVTYTITVKGLESQDYDFGELIVDKEYAFKLEAKSNVTEGAEIFFEVKNAKDNALPAGLKLLADGTLIGRPEESGLQTFTVLIRSDGHLSVESKVSVDIKDFYTETPEGDVASPIKEKSGCNKGVDAFILFAVVPAAAFVFVKKKLV